MSARYSCQGAATRRRGGLRAEVPTGQSRPVLGLRVARDAQRAALLRLSEDATPVGLEDGGPEVLAASGVGEEGAGAIDLQASLVVGQADGVTIAALHFAIEVGLVGVGDPDGVAVEEIQALEL